jgi:hypothetical protein
MKKLKLIGFLMMLASSFLFINCTSDPIEGPSGTAGIDGIDGLPGVDGLDSTADCRACHSKEHRDPIKASYLLSVHAMETLHEDSGTGMILTTSEYTNRTGCVQCHTGPGYIDKMNGTPLATGAGTAAGDPAYPVGALGENSDHVTAISCNTCHDSHSSFDFDNDGNDFALRQGFMAVTLDQDPTYSIDMGTSNTCVNCHQPRGLPPTAGLKLSGRFGPHHGPQSTLLEGIQGAEIAGTTPYPAAKSATHRTGSSCVKCHMGETTDGTDGAHSWHPTENTCLGCHSGGAPEGVEGYDANMAILAGLLEAKGIFNAENDNFNSVTTTLNEAQAAWNFALLREDRSKGIHNPDYAKALIANSIEALQP